MSVMPSSALTALSAASRLAPVATFCWMRVVTGLMKPPLPAGLDRK